jgi:hypothetical protein
MKKPSAYLPLYGNDFFEAIAGTLGALEYLQWVGETAGPHLAGQYPSFKGRRLMFKKGNGRHPRIRDESKPCSH